MNSLYGRLGISPESTVNDVVDDARRKHLLQTSEKFLYSHPLENNWHSVAYRVNTQSTVDKWTPHKNSAVQMAAAITAYARIHLYPYIARDDCYYTDTDSVVLGHPLPCDVLSSSEIGKWKLEDKIKKGIFLAPKVYTYTTAEGGADSVNKFKGPAKRHATPEWFESQYADPTTFRCD